MIGSAMPITEVAGKPQLEFDIRKKAIAALAVGVFALPFSAFAQEAKAIQPTNPAATGAETPDNLLGDEIIVTARRREETIQDVPVAVSVIGGGTLKNYAIADISQIAQLVPQLVVGRQVTGSSASIFLRGVGSSSLSAGFDQSVSLNLDGIPMSRGRELVTSQFDIKRVEVLKGPQALFFGKNSTAGVITILSADPTDRFDASVTSGYEFVADEVYGDGFISGPLAQGLSGRIAVRASRAEGPFRNSAQANNLSGFIREPTSNRRGKAKTLAGRVTLKYDGSDTFDSVLKIQGTSMDAGGLSEIYERKCAAGRTVPLPVLGVPNPFADCRINGVSDYADVPPVIAARFPFARDGDPYLDHTSYLFSWTNNLNLANVTLTSVSGYYGFKQSDLNSMAGSTGAVYVSQSAKYRQFTQELRAITSFEGPINATLGAIYADTNFDFDTAALITAAVLDPATGRYDSFNRSNGFDGTTHSAFAELRWTIIPSLELAGGARWTREKKNSFSQNLYTNPVVRPGQPPTIGFTDRYRENDVSKQASLTWHATDDLMIYGAYKEGWKAGGFNLSAVLFATTTADQLRFGSESASGGEIGFRSTLLNRDLTFNVTAYDYTYKDLQVQVFSGVTNSSVSDNAGKLRTRGVEAEAIFKVSGLPGLTLNGNVAYNDAKFRNYVGQCYTGQTIGEGCNLVPNTITNRFTSQDFGGRRPPKAPVFASRIGVNYETPVSSGLLLGLTGDMSYSSRYNYTDALRPDAVQDAFTRWDASLRVMPTSRNWELALIGRNLTDKLIVTTANDFPSQAVGPSGTASGIRPDINAVVDRPRQVYLQLTLRM